MGDSTSFSNSSYTATTTSSTYSYAVGANFYGAIIGDYADFSDSTYSATAILAETEAETKTYAAYFADTVVGNNLKESLPPAIIT